MSKSLSCFSIFLLLFVMSVTMVFAYSSQADDENTDVDANVYETLPVVESYSTAEAALERMPDEELIMMARRIYQSQVATAEMFNRLQPSNPLNFANRREVIEYIRAAMARDNIHGRL